MTQPRSPVMASSVLVVDDEFRVRQTIENLLERAGHEVRHAASGSEALKHLEDREFDVALIDVKMAQMDGLELLRRIRARWPGVAVILMTAYASVPSAVEAMKQGASHYIEKPFTKDQLLDAIAKARAGNAPAPVAASAAGSPFEDVTGTVQAVADAVDLARRSAPSDKPILILGELGTGREQLGRGIHATSPRAAGPFVPVRCATAGEGLELELFGTGNGGRLAEAAGGTLFLDEVGELSAEAQARLLRFLQDGEILSQPGSPATKSDARVIAGSAAPLEEMVAAGDFRQDLWLRLKAVTIKLPALRDRRADLARLVQHFARKHWKRSGPAPHFGRDAMKVLATLPFPGNLGELEDMVAQAIALSGGSEVTPELLAKMGVQAAAVDSEGNAMRTRVELEEKRAVEEALRRNPKNLRQAAQELNISRTTLWRKMKKYDVGGR